MTIIFDGTNGITSPGGDTANTSYTTPIVKSPSSLTLQTNGSTTAMTIDTSQKVGIGTANTLGNSLLNVAEGIVARNSGGTSPYFQLYNGTAGTDLKTWRIGGSPQGNLIIDTVNDAYSVGTERMRIDSSGRVTIPNQPSFLAQVTGGQSFSTGWNLVQIQTHNSTFDNGGNVNYSTERFTAPVAGKYLISGAVTINGNNTDGTLTIYRNGADLLCGASQAFGSNLASTNVTYVVNLNANDYVQMYYYTNSTVTTRDTNFAGYFSGFLIG